MIFRISGLFNQKGQFKIWIIGGLRSLWVTETWTLVGKPWTAPFLRQGTSNFVFSIQLLMCLFFQQAAKKHQSAAFFWGLLSAVIIIQKQSRQHLKNDIIWIIASIRRHDKATGSVGHPPWSPDFGVVPPKMAWSVEGVTHMVQTWSNQWVYPTLPDLMLRCPYYMSKANYYLR